MIGRGRPLRFLAITLCGWVGVRVALLWPQIDSIPALIHALAPPALAATIPPESAPQVAAVPLSAHHAPAPVATSPSADPAPAPHRAPDPTRIALALASLYSFGTPDDDPPLPGHTVSAATTTSHRSRLSGSAWLLVRGGPGVAGGVDARELGGSQAGLRLSYALGTARRVAITARVTGALGARQREAAVGISWQPTRLPVQLVAEQRIALDGGRGGPAAAVIGGLNPTPVAAGFRLEAYGQAGAVLHRGGFADGAARLARPLVALGGTRLDLGVGAWGGVQRGATRLDVGPSLSASLPVAAHRIRVALDWRARVAGNARPESGPALSLGTDF